MTLILDGKKARAFYASRLKEKISALPAKPILAIIQVGEREESSAYIKSKIAFSQEIGAAVEHIKFPEVVDEQEMIKKIEYLNNDKNITGIIVQLPISENLPKQKIIDVILPSKDVDGLTTTTSKLNLEAAEKAIRPATARGAIELLKFYKIPIQGKKVAVLGRSMLTGKPIAEAVSFEGGVVTVCHGQTPRAEEIKITKSSDIVIVAIGKPKFLTSEFFTDGANQTIVDVGINKVADGTVIKLKEEVSDNLTLNAKRLTLSKFVGDVDFENVSSMVYAISPVPGGIGAMTVLALFENLFDCTQNNI